MTTLTEEQLRAICDAAGDNGSRLVCAAGSVDAVACTLRFWRGEECRECGGLSISQELNLTDPDEPGFGCAACASTGRVGAHGRRLVRLQPIREVRLTDLKPVPRVISETHVWAGFRGWVSDRWGAPLPNRIPHALWELLASAEVEGHVKWYRTLEEAQRAMSDALLAEARGPGGPTS